MTNIALLPSLATATSTTPAKGPVSSALRCDIRMLSCSRYRKPTFSGEAVQSAGHQGDRELITGAHPALLTQQGLRDLPTGLWKQALSPKLSL